MTNPVLVEVTRGKLVESRHRGAIAIAGADGAIVGSVGDIRTPVYPRSAFKPLQALALLESGAAGAFGVSDEELALACASHSGEPRHVALVERWLDRLGLAADDLSCGPHPPLDGKAAQDLVDREETPSALHNNCSGKHAGFLTLARHLGAVTRDYLDPAHPAQRLVRTTIAAVCGLNEDDLVVGVDGCSAPNYAMPLGALARGMAGLGRRKAGRRLIASMAAHPWLVAGTGRCCTAIIRAGRGRVIAKTGAEGVYAAWTVGDVGIALKIDDGAVRAAQVAVTATLTGHKVLDPAHQSLSRFLDTPVLSRRGVEVGRIRPAPGVNLFHDQGAPL